MLMKVVPAVLMMSLSSVAFADPAKSWKMVYESNEKSSSPAGFRVLQERNLDYFEGYIPEQVSSAQMTTRYFEYVGTHTCPEGDERLKAREIEFDVCLVLDDGEDCFMGAEASPEEADPCAAKRK